MDRVDLLVYSFYFDQRRLCSRLGSGGTDLYLSGLSTVLPGKSNSG